MMRRRRSRRKRTTLPFYQTEQNEHAEPRWPYKAG
jgi:hypothetical protein